MNYFFIKQKKGRKSVYRIYKTDLRKCEFICSFPTEEAASYKLKQLSKNVQSHFSL